MIPAFRGSDDSRQVRRNLESIDTGARVLGTGAALGIFPEGMLHDSTSLKMIRSGMARMVLQAAEDGTRGIQIVPLGLNYEHKEDFRSSAWINVGDPIDLD